MTSRRRYPLRAIAGTIRGAAAVLAVAGFVAVLIATGRPASARPAAAARVSAVSTPTDSAGNSAGTMRLPDVSRALRLFGFDTTSSATGSSAATTSQGQARVTRSRSRAPVHRWVRPQWGPLTSSFGWRWGRLHAGIDLAGPYGSTIVAATDGCISYAGPESGYGEVMRISDWDGTQTVYGHMSAFLRRSGCVHAGTPIALVGAAGDATGPHLHFEVRIGGTPINPIPFLARRGVFV
jgi:murein DD-endopeptidase MepM/ murein hydrolase activator NlpD